MAYKALYREFRPKTLDEVVRQEHIVTILKNQLQTGRVGHAYLFCGPRGTGKTSVAKIFSKAINCENPKNGSPCGICSTCVALDDENNLDVVEIDAASNNGVDEMRDLREKVQYPPVAGKYKVYIVDEVHMLSTGAFNALLKTLEEPPKHAVFILATTEAHKIPATILSRCMRFDFKLIPEKDLVARLRHVFDSIGKAYDDEAIFAIARAGAGSVRDMLSLADACVSYASGKLTYDDVVNVLGTADFSETVALVKAVLTADFSTAYQKTSALLAQGKSVQMLLKDLLARLSDLAVVATCKNAQKLLALPADRFALLSELASQVDGHQIVRASEIFAKSEADLRFSSSPRTVFETAVLKASMPREDYDTESLLARIAILENKLEKALKEGVQVTVVEKPTEKDQGAGNETIALQETPVEVQKPIKVEDEDSLYDEGFFAVPPPPDEAVTGGNVYFDAPPETPKQPERTVTAPKATANPRATFGAFLRALRKGSKNAVLVTMCMDLDCTYEGGIFVCSTESETVYKSLQKEEHAVVLASVFAEIGIEKGGYAIRLAKRESDTFDKAYEELKKTFSGVNVQMK